MNRWISVLWPSFAVACVAEAVLFAVIDPQQLYLFGREVYFSPVATYSICLFGFWAVGIAAILASQFLLLSEDRVNRLHRRYGGPDTHPSY